MKKIRNLFGSEDSSETQMQIEWRELDLRIGANYYHQFIKAQGMRKKKAAFFPLETAVGTILSECGRMRSDQNLKESNVGKLIVGAVKKQDSYDFDRSRKLEVSRIIDKLHVIYEFSSSIKHIREKKIKPK